MDKQEFDKLINEKELTKDLPGIMGVKGKAIELIKQIKNFDGINHDGIPDVLQAINLAEEAIPLIALIPQAIDFHVNGEEIVLKVKDKAAFAQLLKDGPALVAKSQALLPHKA